MTAKLAIHGGPKVREESLLRPEHVKARFGEEEKRALAEVVDSGRLCSVTGSGTRRFAVIEGRLLCFYAGVDVVAGDLFTLLKRFLRGG